MRKYILLLLMLAALSVNAQVIVKGKVLDSKTGDPIPFVSIGEMGQLKGTSSNIDGEFTLAVGAIPFELFFSHIGYEKFNRSFENVESLEIKMVPSFISLDDVVIQGKSEVDFEIRLIEKAIKRTLATSNRDSYGKALYRQTSKNGSDYSELFEIFYDVRFNSDGLQSWAVQEGRYAMKESSDHPNFLFNKNFTYFSRLFPILQPPTDDFITPMREDVGSLYDLKINGVVKSGDRQLIELEFHPKEEIITPALEGRMWIDSKSHNVLKIQSWIESDELKIIKLTEKGRAWKNYRVGFEMAFLAGNLETPKLDYIKLDQKLDYYDGKEFLQPVKTSALLSFYDYYAPVRNKRLGGKLYRRSGDRKLLDDMGYNSSFWESNPIVKRTPIENEIISSFEASSAFGNIYLNDRDQIQLEKDHLKNDATMRFVKSQFYKNRLTRQKLHLSLDKPFYLPGEEIRIASFLSQAADLSPDPRSGLVAIDLVNVNNEVVAQYRIGIYQGHGAGTVQLPQDLEPGGYYLRSYSPWMLNFDERFLNYVPLQILGLDQETLMGVALSDGENVSQVDLGMVEYAVMPEQSTLIYPESGILLAGVANQLYIEDKQGTPERPGEILNQNGKKVADFITDLGGMASAFIMVDRDSSYKLRWSDTQDEIEIASITESGLKMQVNNRRSNEMQIRVLATPDLEGKRFYLLIRGHDQILYREMAQIKKNFAVLRISKDQFPEGVVQLSIIDQDRQIFAERLAFIYHNRSLDVLAEPTLSRKKRGPNSILFQILDSDGRPEDGRYSISIVDAEKISDFQRGSIANSFWLSSEIFSQFPFSDQLGHQPSEALLNSLDLWLSGQRIKNYQWPEIFASSRRKAHVAPMQGLTLKGKVMGVVGQKGIAGRQVSLVPLDGMGQVDVTQADENGNFEYKNLHLLDGGAFFLQANKDDGEAQSARFEVEWPIPEPNGTIKVIKGESIQTIGSKSYLAYAVRKQKIDSMYNFSDDILLDEVTITGRAKGPDGARSWHQSNQSNDVLKIDESMYGLTNLLDLIAYRVPGVGIYKKEDGREQLSIRGNDKEPLILLDGMQLNSPMSAGYTPTDMRSILNMSIPDIDRIEVLKDVSNTGIYGLQAFGGVVAIFSKEGGRGKVDKISSMKAKGFAAGIFFPGPNYEEEDPAHAKPDLRTTLYWDGAMQLDPNGIYEAKFFSSDQSRQYLIVIEGISDSGRPLTWVRKIPE